MIKNNPEALKARRIILLRAKEQAGELSRELEKLGAKVILCPLIEVTPNKEVLEKLTLKDLLRFDAFIFTSVNGVKTLAKHLEENKFSCDALNSRLIYVIGPKTKKAGQELGLQTQDVPGSFEAEGLIEFIGDHLNQKKVLILTAEGARDILLQELKKRGAEVTRLFIYKNNEPETHAIAVKNNDIVLFTSTSTVDRFFTAKFYDKQNILAFCIGHVTAEAVKKYQQKNIFLAKEATMESLVESVLDYVNNET